MPEDNLFDSPIDDLVRTAMASPLKRLYAPRCIIVGAETDAEVQIFNVTWKGDIPYATAGIKCSHAEAVEIIKDENGWIE